MNQKQYTITINGVSESISQIDALLAKLNEIENRLKNINTSSLNTSSSKQTSSATGTEAKQQEEVAQATRTTAEENQRNLEALVGINRQLAENTNLQKEAMEVADRILGSNQQLHEINEQYKKDLEAIKLDRKEIDALEKYGQISAEEALERRTQLSQKEMEIKTARQQNLVVLRNEQKLLTAEEGSYQQISYTLSRLKEALKQVNAGNLSPEDFQKLAGAIDETDKKAKAMAASMGEFQRNVGNYPSAFEGIEGIKIKIGETEAEFGSAIEATKKLRTAMLQLALEGKDDTEQWHQYEDAVSQVKMAQEKVADAFDRAKDASKGLHDVIEMFEGVASITAVGQGVSNLFGIDDGEIQKKIQQMTSLIGVMNGLQKLSTQMATGTGIGPALKKLFDTAGSSPVAMFKNVRDQLKGMFADSEEASGGFLKMGNVMNNLKKIGTGLWKGLVAGLATGGVMMAIDLAISGFQELAKTIQNAISMEDDAERSARAYSAGIDASNERLKRQIELIEQKAKLEGKDVNDIEVTIEKLDAQRKAIEENAEATKTFVDVQTRAFANFMSGAGIDVDFSQAKGSLEQFNDEIVRLSKEAHDGADVEGELQGRSAQLAATIVTEWHNIDKSNNDAVLSFAKMVDALGGVQTAIQTLGTNSDDYFGRMGLSLKNTISDVYDLAHAINNVPIERLNAANSFDERVEQARRAAMSPSERNQYDMDKDIERLKKLGQQGQKSAKEIADGEEAIRAEYAKTRADHAKTSRSSTSMRKNRVSEAERTARELAQIEKQIQLDKINAMRDGLTKSLELIRREREERLKALEKFKGTDKYNTLVEDTNAIFDDREQKARLEFVKEYTKSMRELKTIERDLKHEVNETIISVREVSDANKAYEREAEATAEFIDKALQNQTENYKKYTKLLDKVSEQQMKIAALEKNGKEPELVENLKAELARDRNELLELSKQLADTEVDADDQEKSLFQWSEYYKKRFSMQQDADTTATLLERQALTERFNYELDVLKKRKKEELEAVDERYQNLLNDTEGLKEIGKTQEEIVDEVANEKQKIYEHYNGLIALNEKALIEEIKKIDNEYHQDRVANTENFYDNVIGEIDKYANYVMNKASELEKNNTNSWGIINLPKLKKQRKEAEVEIQNTVTAYKNTQVAMRALAQAGMISPDAFKKFNDEIDNMVAKLKEAEEELKKADPIGAFISSINTYIQEVGNAVSTLMSSIYDYQESLLDAEEDALDKQNEMLENKLSEQEEITRKHKEAMDEIESELQTARGDRRDALIDQLNAEVAAQRASLAAEKRIKAQQEALEDKKDALDLKRKKMQQQQSKTQAIISAALATANGYATQPFIPVGLAMGTLAAALGAAQVALISKQKFAEGGKVVGPSHAQGGVQAELEGNEYVINRNAYSRNTELVELINNAGRRLTISDLQTVGYEFPSAIETNQERIVVMPEQQEIWVSVTDINRANQRLAKVSEMAR